MTKWHLLKYKFLLFSESFIVLYLEAVMLWNCLETRVYFNPIKNLENLTN